MLFLCKSWPYWAFPLLGIVTHIYAFAIPRFSVPQLSSSVPSRFHARQFHSHSIRSIAFPLQRRAWLTQLCCSYAAQSCTKPSLLYAMPFRNKAIHGEAAPFHCQSRRIYAFAGPRLAFPCHCLAHKGYTVPPPSCSKRSAHIHCRAFPLVSKRCLCLAFSSCPVLCRRGAILRSSLPPPRDSSLCRCLSFRLVALLCLCTARRSLLNNATALTLR